MERRPRTRTTLALSLLTLTLIAPWALGQDRDLITATRLAAEQGDARAQFALGLMYRDGRGVAQDDAEAVRWFRLAAEQGMAEAQFNLGGMYVLGEGVPQDDTEAEKWFRLAAEQGNADAQYIIGLMYGTGDGLPEDYVLGYAWLNLAAEQGHESAIESKNNLGTRMTPDQIARAQELSVTLLDPASDSTVGAFASPLPKRERRKSHEILILQRVTSAKSLGSCPSTAQGRGQACPSASGQMRRG